VAYTSRGVLRGLHVQLEPEPQGESDEPDAPLLLERELAVEEGDVVIGRKQSNQANNAADEGFRLICWSPCPCASLTDDTLESDLLNWFSQS
jgi:hypothetical protein